jgi:hypothetical protein
MEPLGKFFMNLSGSDMCYIWSSVVSKRSDFSTFSFLVVGLGGKNPEVLEDTSAKRWKELVFQLAAVCICLCVCVRDRERERGRERERENIK